MHPRLLASSILVFGLVYSFMSSVRAEDLVEVYKQAATNDAQYRAARAQMQATMEAKPQARARFLPSLRFGAEYSRSSTEVTTGSVTTKDDYPTTAYSLTLVQPLYHADAFAQNDQADAQLNLAEAQFQAEEQFLALRAAENYFSVLSAQDNLAFAKAEQESIGKQLEQTKQRFNVGLIAITDVHEAQARYDLANASVIAAENRLANAWEALRETTGQNYKSLATLSDVPLVPPTPGDAEQWVQGALKQNPGLQATRFALDVAEGEVRRQRGTGYPSLDAVGTYSNSDTTSELTQADTERTATSIALQLNWSIYEGGAVSSATRRAGYDAEQAKEFLEQQRRVVSRQTREAYLAVLANISRVNALKQAVVSNKSALSANEAGYEVGTRTTVDVLNARTSLFLAQRDYAQSRYDYVLATLSLKAAAGTLGVEALQQVNGWLKK
jgi:outer membrane protein